MKFSFFIDDSTIRILPPNSSISEYLIHLEEMPEENMTIGEMLLEVGSLTQSELDKIEKMQQSGNSSKFFGEIAVDENMVQKSLVEAALQDLPHQLPLASLTSNHLEEAEPRLASLPIEFRHLI